MTPFERHKDLIDRFEPGSAERGSTGFRALFPELIDHVMESIYGFAYQRPQIDLQSRQLLTLAILSTMGDSSVQLKFHLRAALRLGLTAEQIKEVFIQVAVLAGNVRAVNACALFAEVEAEISAAGMSAGA